jgi:hypothetical protein
LKNSLCARFHPISGTKYTGFGGLCSPICGRIELNADFFNRLKRSRKFVRVAPSSEAGYCYARDIGDRLSLEHSGVEAVNHALMEMGA